MPHAEPSEDADEFRLMELIDARTQPDADLEAIDQEIWETFGDDGAVMFTDLTGFSKWTAICGVPHSLQVIYQSQNLLLPIAEQHGGCLIESVADSLLIWFETAVEAIQAAVAMQRSCQAYNEQLPPQTQVLLCIGIGSGRVIRVGYERLAGSEVNAACKLGEDTAEAYEILITQNAYATGKDIAGLRFQRTGVSLPGSEENYRVVY